MSSSYFFGLITQTIAFRGGDEIGAGLPNHSTEQADET